MSVEYFGRNISCQRTSIAWTWTRNARVYRENQGGINEMERPRGVNMIYSAGGDPMCTLQ